MEAMFCPVCCGDYLLGEVYEIGTVPYFIPKEELVRKLGATIVLDAGAGTFVYRDVVLRLPKIGASVIDGFKPTTRSALICCECYAVEPISQQITLV